MCTGTLHSRLPLVLVVALEDLLASCPAKEIPPVLPRQVSPGPSGYPILDYAAPVDHRHREAG